MPFAWFDDFTKNANTRIAKYKNAGFRGAAMGVCALIAAADGTVAPEEKSKVAALIQKNNMLQVFPAAEMRDEFLRYCDMACDEFERLDVLNIVAKVKSNAEQADTVVKIGLIIANADGDFSEDEQKVVQEICRKLGLKPADYGV